ncbi:TPA: MbeB family mobilization protein, partial [Escherichia coli]
MSSLLTLAKDLEQQSK